MSTYDPNGRYEPVDRTGYGVWAVLGIIALFIVIGFIYWGASGGNNSQTASAPVTHTETTGMGSPSVPARPQATPTAPAPAPVGQSR